MDTRNENNTELGQKEIRELRARLLQLQAEAHQMEMALVDKKNVMQGVCMDQGGHEYVEEKDPEYLQRGYCYSCKRCDHLSTTGKGWW